MFRVCVFIFLWKAWQWLVAFDCLYLTYWKRIVATFEMTVCFQLLIGRLCSSSVHDVEMKQCSWERVTLHNRACSYIISFFLLSQTFFVQRCPKVLWQWYRSPGGSDDRASSGPGMYPTLHCVQSVYVTVQLSCDPVNSVPILPYRACVLLCPSLKVATYLAGNKLKLSPTSEAQLVHGRQ